MTKPPTLILLPLLAVTTAIGFYNGVKLHQTENAIAAFEVDVVTYKARNAADRDAYVGCVRFLVTLSQLSQIDACVAESAR